MRRPSPWFPAVFALMSVLPALAADAPEQPPTGLVFRVGSSIVRKAIPGAPVAFAPDGKSFVGSLRGEAMIVDAATGKVRHTPSTGVACRAVAYSADGKLLAVYDIGAIWLWDTTTGKVLRGVAYQQANAFAFSPDGRTVATVGDDHLVRLWNAAAGTETRQLKGHRAMLTAVAFSRDGKLLASAGIDRTFRLWDVATGKELRQFEGHADTVAAILFLPDGKHVLSGSWDGTVRLWDIATGAEVRCFRGHVFQVLAVSASADGSVLASSGNDGTCRLWDAATGKELRAIAAHPESVPHVALSPDGKRVLTGDVSPGARLWDAATGALLDGTVPTTQETMGTVFSVAYAPDGQSLVSASADGTVRLWDAATGKERKILGKHPDAAWCVAFAPDGKTVASVGRRDSAVRRWDVATGRALPVLRGHLGGVSRVVFSRDGSTLVSSGGSFDPTILRWDAATGKELARFIGHGQYVDAVALSPDGKRLASSAREEDAVRLWDAATGGEQGKHRSGGSTIEGLAFSPNGRWLLAAGNGLYLYDASTGQERWFRGGDGMLSAVAISPDSRLVAVESMDTEFKVRIREVATGLDRCQFRGVKDVPFTALAFAPDGRRLAVSASSSVYVYDVLAGRPPARPLAEPALRRLFAALGSADCEVAHAAIGQLVGATGQAVGLLAKELRPVPALDPARLARWVADLDSGQFSVREAATQALEQAGELAGPALRRALDNKPSLEMRQRVETLLARVDRVNLEPDVLRALRAVEVLEHIGTAEARALLEKLAGGAESALLTREARAALAQLAARNRP